MSTRSIKENADDVLHIDKTAETYGPDSDERSDESNDFAKALCTFDAPRIRKSAGCMLHQKSQHYLNGNGYKTSRHTYVDDDTDSDSVDTARYIRSSKRKCTFRNRSAIKTTTIKSYRKRKELQKKCPSLLTLNETIEKVCHKTNHCGHAAAVCFPPHVCQRSLNYLTHYQNSGCKCQNMVMHHHLLDCNISRHLDNSFYEDNSSHFTRHFNASNRYLNSSCCFCSHHDHCNQVSDNCRINIVPFQDKFKNSHQNVDLRYSSTKKDLLKNHKNEERAQRNAKTLLIEENKFSRNKKPYAPNFDVINPSELNNLAISQQLSYKRLQAGKSLSKKYDQQNSETKDLSTASKIICKPKFPKKKYMEVSKTSPSTTIIEHDEKPSTSKTTANIKSDCALVFLRKTQNSQKQSGINSRILVYAPENKLLLSASNFVNKKYRLNLKHLGALIGRKYAKVFFRYYKGKRDFKLTSTVYYLPPKKGYYSGNDTSDSEIDPFDVRDIGRIIVEND